VNGFDLIYFRKDDGKLFYAKRITAYDYALLDPMTHEKEFITRAKLIKGFSGDHESNQRARIKKTKYRGFYKKAAA
jgi:hypothetical protein